MDAAKQSWSLAAAGGGAVVVVVVVYEKTGQSDSKEQETRVKTLVISYRGHWGEPSNRRTTITDSNTSPRVKAMVAVEENRFVDDCNCEL